MKFKFLGTAAAEAVPALFCECDVCVNAAKNKGKDIRRRASYLLDDDTLVDFGPDAFAQSLEFDVDLLKIKRILFTHCHEDHLNPIELLWRRPGFSKVSKNIKIMGSNIILATLMQAYAKYTCITDFETAFVTPVMLWHGQEVTDEELTVLPLNANHAPGKNAHFFSITKNGKNVLVGNDTGYFPEASWELLKGKKFDMVTLDGTMGFKYADSRDGHMGVNVVVEVRDRLREMGCIDDNTKVIVTHFSHNGNSTQADLEAFFVPKGIEVAYDGLTVEI